MEQKQAGAGSGWDGDGWPLMAAWTGNWQADCLRDGGFVTKLRELAQVRATEQLCLDSNFPWGREIIRGRNPD